MAVVRLYMVQAQGRQLLIMRGRPREGMPLLPDLTMFASNLTTQAGLVNESWIAIGHRTVLSQEHRKPSNTTKSGRGPPIACKRLGKGMNNLSLGRLQCKDRGGMSDTLAAQQDVATGSSLNLYGISGRLPQSWIM